MDYATRVSELLFGRKCRLAVALWVRGQKEPFFQSRPPTFGTTSRSNVTSELERLVGLGLVAREQREGRVWYSTLDDPLWRVIDVAAEVAGISWLDDRLSVAVEDSHRRPPKRSRRAN